MGKKHFTEEQIAFALRQAESGTSVARYHRTFIVTPTKRLREKADFQVIDSGWRMNKTSQRAPGSVTSETKLDGSVFWMGIKEKEP